MGLRARAATGWGAMQECERCKVVVDDLGCVRISLNQLEGVEQLEDELPVLTEGLFVLRRPVEVLSKALYCHESVRIRVLEGIDGRVRLGDGGLCGALFFGQFFA